MKLLALLASAVLFASSAPAASPPNIVILYADDMGYGDLAVQNPDSKIPTPNLDRLAAQGMRCTDAHSSSGICSPSRYALLTGRFHWRKFHSIVDSFGPPAIGPEELTVAGMLRAQGYRTACIGKWHLGWNWNDIKKPGTAPDTGSKAKGYAPDAFDWSKPVSGGPLSHGFDYYFGDDVPNFPPYAWIENDRLITVPTESLGTPGKPAEGAWEARPGPMTKGWDFTAVVPRLAEKTVQWIAAQRGKDGPFFLYVPFNSPHAPIVPAPQFRGASGAGGYGDFVVQTDDCAGRILRALEENGFAENTLVIFTADNGPEHYAYDRMRTFGHRSPGPLRGLKRDLYEGGHRVPFIVKWPGVVKAGAVSDALISQVDLMATFAAIAGCELPAKAAEDSFNLLPLWKDNAPSPRQTIVHNTNANAFAIRHENWLLIPSGSGTHTSVPNWVNEEAGYMKGEFPGELYDLRSDPGQKHNLYGDQPEKVRELTALLAQIRSRGQVR